MYFRSEEEKSSTILRLSLIALYILVGFDLAIMALGYYLAQSFSEPRSVDTLMRNIIFLVAVGEFFAIYFIKKTMLQKTIQAFKANQSVKQGWQYSELLKITIVINAMCAGISIYGLALIVLGAKIEILLLFVAMSLIGYQFFRLRPRDFENDDD